MQTKGLIKFFSVHTMAICSIVHLQAGRESKYSTLSVLNSTSLVLTILTLWSREIEALSCLISLLFFIILFLFFISLNENYFYSSSFLGTYRPFPICATSLMPLNAHSSCSSSCCAHEQSIQTQLLWGSTSAAVLVLWWVHCCCSRPLLIQTASQVTSGL